MEGDITIENPSRKTVTFQKDGKSVTLPLFIGKDTVKGKVDITVKPGKTVEHNGIQLQLIGQIELFYDRGNHHQFISVPKELSPAGILSSSVSFDFDFTDIEKQYESYNGVNARLRFARFPPSDSLSLSLSLSLSRPLELNDQCNRYFLKLSMVVRRSLSNLLVEKDFWVHNYAAEPKVNNGLKMEVGIEDSLHIEFEYNKSKDRKSVV